MERTILQICVIGEISGFSSGLGQLVFYEKKSKIEIFFLILIYDRSMDRYYNYQKRKGGIY